MLAGHMPGMPAGFNFMGPGGQMEGGAAAMPGQQVMRWWTVARWMALRVRFGVDVAVGRWLLHSLYRQRAGVFSACAKSKAVCALVYTPLRLVTMPSVLTHGTGVSRACRASRRTISAPGARPCIPT